MAKEVDVGNVSGEAELRHPYEVTYLREDGNEVVEVIWAVNHDEAVKEAEKHGLDILFQVKRETAEAYRRKNRGACQSMLLPVVMVVVFVVGIVGLILWRRGLLHF